jgi:flagellar biosynthesis protein FliR
METGERMNLIGRIVLDIFVFGFPVVAVVGFIAQWRLVKVGAKQFDREFKDFFTSKEKLMLRKLES